ncbi:MAG TPA: tyrosine-protein phosphatase [Solirubrobacteraceae bacterium]|nr:tyrosine-protein phosphatase [Solirubrobacteraceae bacterium]
MTMNGLIPGTYNSRDLGGAPADGGSVRRGAIIRSDAPLHLGAPGRAALRALEIRSAIDLREQVERDLDPADLDGLGLEQHHCPILGADFELAREMSLAEIYRDLLDRRGGPVTGAVRLLANPGTLPAIVFCSAGKDRTGLVSALTLAAAGVSDHEIVADYAATERNMRGAFREALARRAHSAGLSEQEMAVKVGSPAALMRETLRWLRERHGGVREFLVAHGMTEAELDALRQALIVPRAAQAA